MVKNFKHSLREQDLEEIYFQEFPEILSIKREEGSKCGGCAHRTTCNNCPGMALWETQSNQSHVDFACELSEVRSRSYQGAEFDAGSDSASEPTGGGCGSGGCGSGCNTGLLQIGGSS